MINASNEIQLFIGLMSGTSADGIDVALIECGQQTITLQGFISPKLPDDLKQQLITLNETPTIHLNTFCQLSSDIAQQLVKATQQLLSDKNICPQAITAIGSHGQTIFHAPDIPMTLQIGHPAFLAKQIQIQTVADFRVDDMALGGQGAPFAPAFHQVLFQQVQPCFVVNIGGIANVTYLPSSEHVNTAPQGYDTGPGNALMDQISQKTFNRPFDQNGELAAQGKIDDQLITQLLVHPYFSQPQPKSTGRDIFNAHWLNQQIASLKHTVSAKDLLCTLNELTAISIATEISKLIQQEALTNLEQLPVWVVGGGALNTQLIKRIQYHLANCNVRSSQQAGINPNAIEAMMCAWLAKQRIENTPVKLSQVTGADRDAVLGAIWHP
ncbi:MAG: anhydro-N-acetylmuramic acid kinase [Thiomicrorhabdus sp.]|nr:MAG: anhydro-N-acetylmuramic acid kinase [Thiomicrorhabdus sp.]